MAHRLRGTGADGRQRAHSPRLSARSLHAGTVDAWTIRALAAAVARGDLVLEASRGLEDAVARLVAIPGIGTWTAQYVAMRALGEPDAFPAGDLGLRRALANGAGPLPPARVAELAEAWRPWRAYAALHLWTGLAGERGYAENGMFRARHTAVASS